MSQYHEIKRDYSQKSLSEVFLMVAMLAAVLGLVALAPLAFDRNEEMECKGWQQEAQNNPQFYLLGWQAEQCAAHHITVDAPVK